MNVLIVTDNGILHKRIRKIFENNAREGLTYEFRCTKTNGFDSSEQEKIGKIDVKEDYISIIKTFDLIISAHCQQFFPKQLVEGIRCINIHPGYNPINRGWYPQVFAIINNTQIGATIHEMDDRLDHGAIVARKFVDKFEWDDSLTIYNRVLDAEIELFDIHFEEIIDNSYSRIQPENDGMLFRRSDFDALCKIDMNRTGTFREFYNLLRALSHGEYRNAFFVSQDGRKIFVKVEIDEE
jgi:methionyl-tRNA formyltransferase